MFSGVIRKFRSRFGREAGVGLAVFLLLMQIVCCGADYRVPDPGGGDGVVAAADCSRGTHAEHGRPGCRLCGTVRNQAVQGVRSLSGAFCAVLPSPFPGMLQRYAGHAAFRPRRIFRPDQSELFLRHQVMLC